MTLTLLAPSKNFLIKGLAWVLKYLIQGIYWLGAQILETPSMALTIFLMTFVVRALMMPLQVKQQKSSRAQQKLQPQIQAIQAKYKNKQDPDAQQKMQAEISKVYSENHASPLAGCLPLLIQMPILFALYEIFRNIPFYVEGIGSVIGMKELFVELADKTMSTVKDLPELIANNFANVTKSLQNFDATTENGIIDFLYHLSTEQWKSFGTEFTNLFSDAKFLANYELQNKINSLNLGFTSLNLSEAPNWAFSWKLLVPLFAGGFTLLQTLLSQHTNNKRAKIINPNYKEDETQKTSKIMMYVSPIMITFFAVSLPMGLGIYWIASSIFGILSMYVADKIIDKQDYKAALAKKQAFEEKQLLNRTINPAYNNWRESGKVNKSELAGDKTAQRKNNETD